MNCRPVSLMEAVEEHFRDLEGELSGIDDSVSKSFSSCHMTSDDEVWDGVEEARRQLQDHSGADHCHY
jgi:hypothetical protein